MVTLKIRNPIQTLHAQVILIAPKGHYKPGGPPVPIWIEGVAAPVQGHITSIQPYGDGVTAETAAFEKVTISTVHRGRVLNSG